MNDYLKTSANKTQNRRLIGAIDIAVIVMVVVLSVASLLLQFDSDTSLVAVVRVNGDVVCTVPLDNIDEPYDKTFNGDLPVTVHFSKDGVCVTESDCPDKLCIHSGTLSKAGESAVCLPAKVSLAVTSSDNDVIDAVVG